MSTEPRARRPRICICIFDNDNLDAAVAPTYVSYGAMTEAMFAAAGADWSFERFNTTRGEYPLDLDAYDAVLLTGSRAASRCWASASATRSSRCASARRWDARRRAGVWGA
jgi:hypothetical protein